MTTPQGLTIRPARHDERAEARALTLDAYAQYAELMAPSAWEALRQAVVTALGATGPAEHLVAVQGGALLGSVMLFPASGGDTAGAGGRMIWPELRLLAVREELRGRGIGTALVRACAERARAWGAPALGLYSSESMRSALALYERLGFARQPQYDFRPPGAELVRAYRLELAGGQ